MPKVYVFAGANGSGKTTFARTIIGKDVPFINADEIKSDRNISGINAAKKALREIGVQIKRKAAFAFETTMSGRTLANTFKKLGQAGFEIEIFYFFAYPIELLRDRIEERVKRGGHFVPFEDVKRRYGRSLKIFWYIYKPFAVKWTILANSGYEPTPIATGKKDSFQINESMQYEIFKKELEHAGNN